MPANKNALIRYRFLDELLSSRVSYYTREELWNKVNERLVSPVSKRCIEKDLVDIQDEWGIDYEEILDEYGKRRIHYADKSFSIFNKELTEEERKLLKSALDTLGQFDGLPNFEWLEAMRVKLSKGGRSAMSAGEFEDDGNKIIEFGSNHYLKNSNMIAGLFQHIASKQVIQIEYRPYQVESSLVETVSPYRLKQYNNRWYLLCCRMSDGRFSNYALDRLVSYEKVDGIEYMPCPVEIDEHFDDIIGVTFLPDDTHDVSGYINLSGFVQVNKKDLPIAKADAEISKVSTVKTTTRKRSTKPKIEEITAEEVVSDTKENLEREAAENGSD